MKTIYDTFRSNMKFKWYEQIVFKPDLSNWGLKSNGAIISKTFFPVWKCLGLPLFRVNKKYFDFDISCTAFLSHLLLNDFYFEKNER